MKVVPELAPVYGLVEPDNHTPSPMANRQRERTRQVVAGARVGGEEIRIRFSPPPFIKVGVGAWWASSPLIHGDVRILTANQSRIRTARRRGGTTVDVGPENTLP